MAVGGLTHSLKAPVSCGSEDAARQRGRLVVVRVKSVFAAAVAAAAGAPVAERGP